MHDLDSRCVGRLIRSGLVWLAFTAACMAVPHAVSAKVDLVGTVVSSGERPVPGATVYVYTARLRHGVSAVCPSCYFDCGKHEETAKHGEFKIRALDDSLLFRVLVVAQGFEPRFAEDVDPSRGPLVVRLSPRDTTSGNAALRVRGRVIDHDGTAVVGATVSVLGIRRTGSESYGSVPGSEPLAVSDAAGDFVLSTADSDVALIVLVRARGFAPRYFDGIPAGLDPARLVLSRGATLRGQVLLDARPAAGVAVVVGGATGGLIPDFGRDTIATDDGGWFSFVNLPCNHEYRLAACMESLRGRGATRTIYATLGDQDSVGIAAPLLVVPALKLSGRVLLTDGRPVPPGTRVTLWHGPDDRLLEVGRDGQFEADGVPPEAISLSVSVRGYRLSSRMPATLPRRGNMVAVGMTRDRNDVDLILEPGFSVP